MALNILITGALGHVGSALIRAYSKREDVSLIRMLDNLSTQRYCSLFNLPEGKKYQFIEGDINNIEILRKAMQNIDVVIHLAAIADATYAMAHPEETEKINLIGTQNVLNMAIETGVKKFIFPSTTSVYGEAEGTFDENSPNEVYKPVGPYAECKRKAEKIVQESNGKNGIQTFVIRKGTIFGKSIGMRFHTAINKFSYLTAINKPLTVWDSALDSIRPYLGINDATNAYEFIEKYGKPGEIYNVLTKNYPMREIISSIKKSSPEVSIEIVPSPLSNQKPFQISNEKIKKLGFEFKDDLTQSIKETVELFRKIHYSGIDNQNL